MKSLPALTLLLVLLCCRPADGRDRVSLGVPEDAFIYLHWRTGDADGVAARSLRGLRDALRASGVLDELIGILRERRKSADEQQRFDVEAEHWRRTLDAVDWWGLVSGEAVCGIRRGASGRFEILFLFQTEDGSTRDAALRALRNVLYGVAAVLGEYELVVADRDGVPTTVLYSLEDATEQVCLGGHGGTVAVATSVSLLRQSLQLLEGRGSSLALVHSSGYGDARSALRGVPASAGDESTGRLEIYYRPGDAFRGVDSLDVLNVYHRLTTFERERIEWSSRYVLEERAGSENPLAAAFASQRDIRDLVERIPIGTASLHVQSGADPVRLLDYLFDLVAVLSGGPLLPEALQRGQSSASFDLKEDLLDHFSGRRSTLAFEAAPDGGASGKLSDRVFLFELEQGDAAGRELGQKIESLVAFLRGFGLEVEPLEIPGVEGKLHVADTTALIGSPIHFGLGSSGFALSASRQAFEMALRPATGTPSIVTDPGLERLWKETAGSLDELAYGRLQASALQDLAALLRFVGPLARLVPAGSDAAELSPFLRILPRLAPAIEALRIEGTTAGIVTREGGSYLGRGSIAVDPVPRAGSEKSSF